MRLCTNCGFKNPDGSGFCVRCGANLSSQPPALICPSCGAPNIPGTDYCEACGSRVSRGIPDEVGPKEQRPLEILYPPPGVEYDGLRSSVQKTRSLGKPFWAGALMVVGGTVDVVNGVAAFFRDIPSNDLGIDLSGYVACCAALAIIFGFGAILGGVLSLRKEHFYVVLAGTIMGMLGVGFFWSGALLCLIALILVAISRDEYDS